MRATLILVALLAGPAIGSAQDIRMYLIPHEALVRYVGDNGMQFETWEAGPTILAMPGIPPGLGYLPNRLPPLGTPLPRVIADVAGTRVTFQRTYQAYAFKDIRGPGGARVIIPPY
jgi:hypothetical protein